MSFTVALVFPGNSRDPRTRSGTPLGLATGLEELGVEVVHVRAEPPAKLKSGAIRALAASRLPRRESRRERRMAAVTSPVLSTLQGQAARRRLARMERLDGGLQVTTPYTLGTDLRVVTHDDMTIPLALRPGFAPWAHMSARAVARRSQSQGRAYHEAAVCCATSHWAAESIRSDYGVPGHKVKVVGVGRNHTPAWAERDWSAPRFLFVGVDWERKNGPLVLNAFERLRRELPGATLDLVGGHPAVDAKGVTGHGVLSLADPADAAALDGLYRRSTCFVLPSRLEPFGISFSEASAAGMPCIGTTAGGCVDLIGRGRLVDPGDEAALLAAMRELSNPDTAPRLGARAHERSKLFTWRAVAERLLRAFEPPGMQLAGLADFL